MTKKLRLAAVLLLMAIAALTSSSIALAEGGDIEVTEATALSQFPDGILFKVAVESEGIVDEVRVFIKKADEKGRSSYRGIDLEPAESISGDTLLPASGSDYFPPGTKISYYFEVRDKAGGVVRTDETDFVYEDIRFQWLTVSDGLITVYYYSEYVEERARIILDAAKQTMDRMVPVLGIAPTDPLRIVTYNNYRHMVMALPFRSQTVSEDLQAQGMAFSDERVLLVHGFDPTVTGTTSHEFTHLLVAEAAGGTAAAVPAWLNEGLAEYGNIDKTDEYDAALRYGIFTRRIRPLWFQHTFSGAPEDIIIAYGQGKSVVSFMVREWGEDRISELFEVVRRSNDIDIALMQVYGLDQHGMDSAWRVSLGLEPLPSPEELEEQMKSAAESQDPEDSSEPASADQESESSETESESSAGQESDESGDQTVVQPLSTNAPTEEPESDSAEQDSGSSSSPCSAPPPGGSPIGLGALALMATPLSLAGIPFLRRFRRKD